ncbi:MAG: metallophosphoesterase [Candidatus Pacearchaeota archaeon]
MKLLVIGDLHGRKPIIKNKDFDALILAGDICDDRKIAPFYKKFFKLIKNKDFDEDFDEWLIREIGKKRLKEYEKESVNIGRKTLKYIDSFGKPIFMVAGNWDQSYGKSRIKSPEDYYSHMRCAYDLWLGDKINPSLTKGIKNLNNCMFKCIEFKGIKNLNNCMFKCIEFKGINFIGYGLSSAPEKPNKKFLKKIKDKEAKSLKKSYKKILDKLNTAYKERKNKKLPTLFITHNIPYNTKLDTCKDKESYAYKKHLGSTIARTFCEKFRPLICTGGHVHEGKGKDKIGKTTIINPGYGKQAQILIEINEKKKIKKIEFL